MYYIIGISSPIVSLYVFGEPGHLFTQALGNVVNRASLKSFLVCRLSGTPVEEASVETDILIHWPLPRQHSVRNLVPLPARPERWT